MFEYITGEVMEKNPTHLVLRVGGVAFRIIIPLSTYEALPDKGEVKIFTELYLASSVQESAIRLYGFATADEKRLFLFLCSVQRIGPNTALRILSSTSVAEFRQAVLGENIRYLEKLKGVGTKTAQRIILELKEPFSTWRAHPAASSPGTDNTIITDAILALVSLGYPRLAAERAVREVTKKTGPDFTAEELVKRALQQI